MEKVLRQAFGADFTGHKHASITSDSTDSLQVIGAGLPRCGTSSLKAALEILGFDPCHHMVEECFEHSARSRSFSHILDAQRLNEPSRVESLRTAMLGYKATVDSPGADVYLELKALYPSAKVILNVRDSAEAWWRSVTDTIDVLLSGRYGFLTYPSEELREQRRLYFKLKEKWDAEGGYGPGHYKYHIEQVRKNVPKEQLLEFNVKQGWGPLCEFLGVEVPDVPFPNVNDTKAINTILFRMQIVGACTWAFYLGAAGAAAWMAFQPPSFIQGLFAANKPL